MDDLDLKIITALQRDGRTVNVAIARSTGVSEETIRRRTSRLIRDGVISIVAIPNAEKMGIETQALIGLHVNSNRLDAVAEALAELGEVSWVVVTTGSFDVMAWVHLRSADGLGGFLSGKVGRIEGVQRTETFVCMENVKEQYGVVVE